MDLANFDTTKTAEEGAELVIQNPKTGQPFGDPDPKKKGEFINVMKIRLAGADSERYREFVRRRIDRTMNSKSQRMKTTFTMEESEEQSLDLLAHCTLSWENVVVDGKPLVCSAESAKELYRRFRWIREQVDSFVGDRNNFLPS